MLVHTNANEIEHGLVKVEQFCNRGIIVVGIIPVVVIYLVYFIGRLKRLCGQYVVLGRVVVVQLGNNIFICLLL